MICVSRYYQEKEPTTPIDLTQFHLMCFALAICIFKTWHLIEFAPVSAFVKMCSCLLPSWPSSVHSSRWKSVSFCVCVCMLKSSEWNRIRFDFLAPLRGWVRRRLRWATWWPSDGVNEALLRHANTVDVAVRAPISRRPSLTDALVPLGRRWGRFLFFSFFFASSEETLDTFPFLDVCPPLRRFVLSSIDFYRSRRSMIYHRRRMEFLWSIDVVVYLFCHFHRMANVKAGRRPRSLRWWHGAESTPTDPSTVNGGLWRSAAAAAVQEMGHDGGKAFVRERRVYRLGRRPRSVVAISRSARPRPTAKV